MLDKTASIKSLKKLFKRLPVVAIDILKETLKTNSRMSIFRRLKEIEYLSSYTHAGRYYTLAYIPRFDKYGLWFYQDVGFSQAGSLKATISHLVDTSPAGLTHNELTHILRVRVHNTLLILVREGSVGRQQLSKTYLYVSTDPDKVVAQLSKRSELAIDTPGEKEDIIDSTVIEVLIETIQAGEVCIAPSVISNRLSVRGVFVSTEQVNQVFAKYGIDTEKKRPG